MHKKTIHKNEYLALINIIASERKRLGISQQEVAGKLGMSQSDISKIESNERRIDIFELKLLLKIYRIESNLKLKKEILTFFNLDGENK